MANEYLEVLDLAFQSTPSAWRETRKLFLFLDVIIFQSTPSAWRETDYILKEPLSENISIHSLRMEGDRSPVLCLDLDSEISIHSLRMEGDGKKEL